MKIEPIYFWPNWFKKILSQKEQNKIPLMVIKKLSQAQVYLWRALNIYDDILDDQNNIDKLPQANRYFRLFLETHRSLNFPHNFYLLINQLFTKLEKYNHQELRDKKIKTINSRIIIPKKLLSYSKLLKIADKSLVLAISPLAILFYMGYSTKNIKIKKGLKFFQLILTAKQLSDDACDWWEDLNNGQLTPITSWLLREAKNKKLKLDLKNPKNIFLLFAKQITPIISQKLTLLLNQARQELVEISYQSPNQLIKNLIEPLEKPINKAKKFSELLAGLE